MAEVRIVVVQEDVLEQMRRQIDAARDAVARAREGIRRLHDTALAEIRDVRDAVIDLAERVRKLEEEDYGCNF